MMNKHSFFRSFSFALAGILSAFKTEQNFKIHLFATIIAVVLAVALRISAAEWLWIALSVALVLGAELMNTALESLADRVSVEQHPLIRTAKDCAAAAVLLMAVFALVCGCVIFLPKIINFLSSYVA